MSCDVVLVQYVFTVYLFKVKSGSCEVMSFVSQVWNYGRLSERGSEASIVSCIIVITSWMMEAWLGIIFDAPCDCVCVLRLLDSL